MPTKVRPQPGHVIDGFDDPHDDPDREQTAGEQLVALGWDINNNQWQAVHLAARFDDEGEWFAQGLKGPGLWISRQLQIHHSTAGEWVRVGHCLEHLPLIDAAFEANEISYAKAQILTRWADPDNEEELLDIAKQRPASRLTTAIAKALATTDDDDSERDKLQHETRSVTSYTDGDGMTVIRIVLPPATAKPVLAAVDELVRRIAATPPTKESEPGPPSPTQTTNTDQPQPPDPLEATDTDWPNDPQPSANGSEQPTVAKPATPTTKSETSPSANGLTPPPPEPSLPQTLEELSRRWHPNDSDDRWTFPTMAQQRADAFTALFLGLPIDLTTEIVIHLRGDGNTFDDGTPITDHAVARQLEDSYLRLMIHDANRRPINASSRQRHPTTRQKRVVLETHNHECVDCQSTDLLELDHDPPYEQTRHTLVDELLPRCAPCHRARHRHEATHSNSGWTKRKD